MAPSLDGYCPWCVLERWHKGLRPKTAAFRESVMSDLLAHFDFDIFLSYGWSGLVAENKGDRAWVGAFKESLQAELSGALGRQPRIFFDIDEPVTDIEHRLREAA